MNFKNYATKYYMEVLSKTILKVLSLTAVFIGVLYLAYLTRHEIFWLITAFSLSLALNPIVAWLSARRGATRRGRHGRPNWPVPG